MNTLTSWRRLSMPAVSWTFTCMAALFLAMTIPAAAAPNLPSVTVPFTAVPPEIDGKLDDAVWENGAHISGFRGSRTGDVVNEQTSIRMMYDEHAIYFAIRCDEPNPAGIVAAATNERAIWGDDAVAIMLDPGEPHTYYQFAVNPQGLKFDQKVITFPVEQKLYGEYEPDWDVRVLVGKDHWSAEIAIPYEALGTGPQMGRVWRMNIFRVRQQSPYEKTSFWSYAFNSHTRDNWGKVMGIVIGAESSDGLRMTAMDAGAARIGTNQFQASFAAALPADMDVTLGVTAPSGITRQFAGEASGAVRVRYILRPEEGLHTLAFTLKNKSGSIVYQSPPAQFEVGNLIDSYVERNYYTSEKTARVICLAPELDAATLGETSLQVRIEKTDVRNELPAPLTARTEVELPLGNVAPGDYTVAVEMKNGDNKVFASQSLPFRKLMPGKGSEVKIVRRDRSAYLLFNDEPYFMLGTDLHDYPGDIYELIREMAESGFNMLAPGFYAKDLFETEDGLVKLMKIMDECHANDIKVCLYPEAMPWEFGAKRGRQLRYAEWGIWGKHAGGPIPDDAPDIKRIHANVENTRQLVQRFMNHPALLLYHGFDEADTRNQKEDELFMHFLRDVDPYHPFERIFGPGPIIDRYGDIYNVHRYMSTVRPLTAPYENALRNKPIANNDRKPLHVFVGGMASPDFRGPTAAEYRCQMYMVLIGGGRGIIWFAGRHRQLACWNAIKSVTSEINELIPILLEPDIPQEITVEQSSSKPVYVWLMRHNGRRWILAANCRKSPTEATIILPDLQNNAKIKVHFENRSIIAKNGQFTEAFGEYGVHVYEVEE